MLEIASTIAARADFSEGTTSSQVAYSPNIKVGGSAFSGPSFVDNDGYRKYLELEFEAKCTDREAGAVAHIAYQNNVPFLVVLTVSAEAGAEEQASSSFPEFAAQNTHTVITALLRAPAEPEPTFPPGGGSTYCVLFVLLVTLFTPFL